MVKRNPHVVKSGNRWAVKKEGSSSPVSTHKSQSLAIDAAIPIAKSIKGEVIIHGRDGRIRDKDSYGPDSCPPKDKRH
ncbi:MAG: DUF2188 domain-containing protein [Elusimicrobiota bacterium]